MANNSAMTKSFISSKATYKPTKSTDINIPCLPSTHHQTCPPKPYHITLTTNTRNPHPFVTFPHHIEHPITSSTTFLGSRGPRKPAGGHTRRQEGGGGGGKGETRPDPMSSHRSRPRQELLNASKRAFFTRSLFASVTPKKKMQGPIAF